MPPAKVLAECAPGVMLVELENEKGTAWKVRLVERPGRRLLLLSRRRSAPRADMPCTAP